MSEENETETRSFTLYLPPKHTQSVPEANGSYVLTAKLPNRKGYFLLNLGITYWERGSIPYINLHSVDKYILQRSVHILVKLLENTWVESKFHTARLECPR